MKYSDEEIIAWLNDELDENLGKEISEWIENSEEAQSRVAEFQLLDQAIAGSLTYEPSPEMLYSFREKIIEERDESRKDYRWFQAAAAIVLMVAGFGAGRVTMDGSQSTQGYSELKNEVQVLQQMVMMNSLKDHTASERLQVINTIEETPSIVDEKLIETLIQTMNSDDNTNVRFAAIQALGKFKDLEEVKYSMIRSLGYQEDPLVQIALINQLMEAKEQAAIGPIRKIADNESSPDEVRRIAEIALDVLI